VATSEAVRRRSGVDAAPVPSSAARAVEEATEVLLARGGDDAPADDLGSPDVDDPEA
jgi:hypothetical protein